MAIPEFPASIPITPEVLSELNGFFMPLMDGISEFTFTGLYLFRSKYNYRLSVSGGALLIFSERGGKTYFTIPDAFPPSDVLDFLLKEYDEWKLISPSLLEREKEFFEKLAAQGFSITADRGNFDYLYNRTDLANLSGKAFHKKKNHVNTFIKTYKTIRCENLSQDNISAAREVLDAWFAAQKDPANTDYKQAIEALEAFDILDVQGFVVFADDIPAAWCLSDFSANGTIVTVHFEKARPGMPGAFQYVNYAFARSLPETVLLINREQDLGDEGLRQAKMTYRPCGFVKKYAAKREQ